MQRAACSLAFSLVIERLCSRERIRIDFNYRAKARPIPVQCFNAQQIKIDQPLSRQCTLLHSALKIGDTELFERESFCARLHLCRACRRKSGARGSSTKKRSTIHAM